MCQILALNANSPTDISFSFEGFVNRAGITDTNVDGTGIAFFEDHNTVRILKDNNAASNSYVRTLVRSYAIKSKNIIAHIRRASCGANKLENCHPFVRELWNENWVFAHNGHLTDFPGLKPETATKAIGDTDSERFFLHIIDTLSTAFDQKPSNEVICEVIQGICDQYSQFGALNFVLSNGTLMFAHCSTNLYYIQRSGKDDNIIRRLDDGGIINLGCYAKETDLVTIICTMPITNEYWHKMTNGQLLCFDEGELIYNVQGIPSVIDERFERLTGLSTNLKQKIDREQADYKAQVDRNITKSCCEI